ncbi:MAG: glucoamylase family protein [Lysobacterales bacterium]
MNSDISWGDDTILKKLLLVEISKRLQKIYDQLQPAPHDEERLALARELFLDNFNVLTHAAVVCQEFLVEALYRRLPVAAGSSHDGLPRIALLACALINTSELQLDEKVMRGALSDYQEYAALTVAEIWALPIMLRRLLLSECISAMAKLLPDESLEDHATLSRFIDLEMPAESVISRSINALRLLDTIDWKDFFDAVSKLEAELALDPAGVYAAMDFPTRDRYRKVVEGIAWQLGRTESEIAGEVLAAAHSAPPTDVRRRHIGYYLIDRGLGEFEQGLGFRPCTTERIRRLIRRHATGFYLSGFAVSMGIFMLPPFLLLVRDNPPLATWCLLIFLALMPASNLGVELLHWLVTRMFHPERLPRMDFSKGITHDAKTIVAVPAMLDNAPLTTQLVEDLEVRYLSNPDPGLSFVLLTDFLDAPAKESPADKQLLKQAEVAIHDLNQTYADSERDKFYLLHRERLWSEGEQTWKGWERKRGKIVEFNRWLTGDENTSFRWQFGRTQALQGTRFVITLDADTKMPKGAARALASIMAHPLNTAEFDPQNQRVIAGYTVIQPRVEIDPASEESSEFTRIVSGDIGLDPYSHAVSDAYQDLFGTGIYVGKGIYDVATFTASLAHTLPPSRVLSHDLLEGVLGRAGLASDIVVYEHFPPNHIAYTRRMHRWIRGDWQLLPWLAPRIPVAGGSTVNNPIQVIDRWKILDNLRRSLFFPFLFVFLAGSWLLAPSAWPVWTLLGILAPAAFLLVGLTTRVINGFRHSGRRGLWTALHGLNRIDIERWFLTISFACHLALVSVDAIVRTLTRMFITHHHLLEWVTFSAANAGTRTRSIRKTMWREMYLSSLFAAAVLILIALTQPAALPYGAPVLLLWILAPELARWMSTPPRDYEPESLDQDDITQLRELAFRTWHFYEAFVTPNNHWLPPDNFQESPRGEIAQRTSPTNIAMMFLSTLVAHELGFIGIANFVQRLRFSLNTLRQMPRHRGHILNWVDTSTLQPLEPRYVSMVDSGNLAGALITLRQACLKMESEQYLCDAQWQGLCSLLGLLEQAVAGLLEHARLESPGAIAALNEMRTLIEQRDCSNLGHAALVYRLRNNECRQLDNALLELLQDTRGEVALADLEEIETWSNDLNGHVESMYLEVETCFPWLHLLQTPPETGVQFEYSTLATAWQELLDIAQSPSQLSGVDGTVERMRMILRDWKDKWDGDQSPHTKTWLRELEISLDEGATAALAIREHLHEVADHCARELEHMDFSLLYDKGRNLFHIGYNVSENRLDPHHYDIAMSEARLASFIAIARGVAPASHWSQMSRPVIRMQGMMILLSWSGTMFEFLMPPLLMRSNRHTLLSRGCAAAVQQQIAYARKFAVPWGISESGYYRFDPNLKYQYKAFGVPSLGLRRSVSEDLVIAPYASLLAISIQPQAVMHNFRRLVSLGALGRFGLYEALDFTRSRIRGESQFEIVRSYMAHHQGMILCALGNYLKPSFLINYFHADPLVRSAESLLNERVPLAIAEGGIKTEAVEASKPVRRRQPQLLPWTPAEQASVPQINILSNGRLATRITEHGAGDLRWSGLSLTRWRPDATRDHWGYRIFLRDEQNRLAWPVSVGENVTGVEENRVVFFPHKVEFSRRMADLFVRTEACVASSDDIDIRRIEIQNESGRERRISLTSYAEIVMADPRSDEMHPAFEKLFTQSRYDSDLNLLEFHRRRRSPEEKPVVLAHCGFNESPAQQPGGFETDRGRFLGRGGDISSPAALANDHLSGTLGNTLDPCLSFQVVITLEPYATKTVNFLTAVAATGKQVREIMARYRNDASCRWALRESMIEHRRELAAIGLNPASMAAVQRLFSELHYPNGRLRSTRFHQGNIRLEQPDLWSFGLSGDFPIVLLMLHDSDEAGLLETLLQAHHYWRSRGQPMALVILDHEPSTYDNRANQNIQKVISDNHGSDWLARHGGIFVISKDQISATEAKKLEAAAAAVLDSQHGTLEDQLREHDGPEQHLPILLPTRPPVAKVPSSLRVKGLRYENEYGGFAPDGREYIIYVEDGQRPPAPWCNVLANPRFGSLTTESGGGYSWFLNSGEYRLTPWSNDPVTDQAAEALYLRDEQSALVWSPLPLPGQQGNYRIHHGAGYTRYVHHSHQLEQETRVFVPPGDSVKIIQLRIRNRANLHRRLTATYYAEWVLGRQRSITQSHIMSRHELRPTGIFADCAWNPEFGACVAFLSSSHVTHGFTCDRTEFLGRHGSTGNPAGLQRMGLSGRSGPGIDPCAALQIHLELDAQEVITCHFLLGAAVDRKTAKQLCRKYQNNGVAENAWLQLQDYWDKLLGTITVSTPEPAMDLLLNRWLLYQAVSSRIFARTGFYQSSGAFGFRDQLQDVMALLQVRPELAREQILEAAKRQFDSGDVLHWWHPPSGKGVRSRCSDDLLWLPYVTGEYVDVSGDTQILQEMIPFLNAPPLATGEHERYGEYSAGSESATLLEHCRRALQKGLTTGPNGLPLIGSGDWNDAMNLVGVEGRGESVWLAWFACAAVHRYFQLCKAAGVTRHDLDFANWVEAVQQAIRQTAWDGAWYRRAFYDDGTPIGSATQTECRIDSISQSWATLSRSPKTFNAKQSLESALEFLVNGDERIIALLTPPFDNAGHDPGYIKGYPPGVRENGGQYTHAAVWLGWALAQQGDGDRAEWLFRLMNPVLRGNDKAAVDRYRVEPYVLAADIYSASQHLGRGGWTWYTGSASWLWRFGIEGLLGLRRTGGELMFDPCIPAKWPGFSAQIKINGATLQVEVRNPHGICRGVHVLETGGRLIASNRIAPEAVKAHHIVVHMGEKQPVETTR